jgi:hypothetical protein
MSPSDCRILFNVCDPVLCPASRCDFGGSFPVDNVIQSGIIGSIALCLPNFIGFKGDVVVPVCLTGIYAGLDSLVSILKAHRDCLQESLDTGRYVGICDEIYSIYLCEFFWRRAAPLLDIAIPKLIEYIYTGGKMQGKGGGEYLTVTDAWDNMQKSVRYFTDYYGLNVFKAFRARSTAEIGTEVCKAFISTRYPSNKNLFNQLLEPESPVQFYARFDEIPFSEATVPATSHYKVFYHIYAGREHGHYYSVYLASPPGTGYYIETPYIVVDSGYVGIGQNIDKAKDFTAPAGYKQLCVKIDTKEECDFKQVTTSFAFDYLKDKYLEKQTSQKITSEKECVSGSASLWPPAQPSLQGGAEEAVLPAVYKRGIVRVCSKINPGNATNPGRWKNIGYCDNPKMRCWLDEESVKNAMDDLGLENKTLKEAEKIAKSRDLEANKIWGEAATNSKLEEARKEFKRLKKEAEELELADFEDEPKNTEKTRLLFKSIELLKKKSFFNSQIAEAFFLEFRLYKILTEKLALKLNIFREKKLEVSLDIQEDKKQEKRKKWTLDSAIKEVKERKGKYSDNREFINQLKEDEILTEKEYKEINGEGLFNLQEDMSYVKKLLLKKKIAERRKSASPGEVEKVE